MTETTLASAALLPALQRTPAVQRLRRVSQAGAPALFKATRSVTRLEHSVGVMRLAQRLGLPVEQQIAALLHDATHSAFSHTLDYLLENHAEDTHERHAQRLLADRTLTSLIGYDQLKDIVDIIVVKPHWLRTLDAVDYTIRDLLRAGLLDASTSQRVINDLRYISGSVCFATKRTALLFVHLMAQVGSELYMDPADLFLHSALAQLLGEALQHRIVSLDDIMIADEGTLLASLAINGALRSSLQNYLAIRPSNLRERRDAIRISSKARLLNPLVSVSSSEMVPLSELWADWRRLRQTVDRRSEIGAPLLTIA